MREAREKFFEAVDVLKKDKSYTWACNPN
jgi:hypothetical protein